MQKAKGAAVDAIQFNTLAVILALVILPLSVAAITQGNGTVSDYVWQMNWEEDELGSMPPGHILWREQGGNISGVFESDVPGSGQCSYLVPLPSSDRLSMCYGAGGAVKVLTSSENEFDYIESMGSYQPFTNGGTTVYDFAGEELWPAHSEPVMLDGASYIGKTTDGPFSWWFDSVEIDFQDSVPIAFRITMIDPSTAYACDNAIFENVSFDMTLSILRPKVSYPYDRWDVNATFEGGNQWVRQVWHNSNQAFEEVCFVGFDMLIPIPNFDALAIKSWIEDGNYTDGTGPGQTTWGDVQFNFKIDDIKNQANQPGYNVAKPWEGDPNNGPTFVVLFQSSTIQEANINLYIKGGTLVLSVLICGVGVASTSYWNPLQNWFKGALK